MLVLTAPTGLIGHQVVDNVLDAIPAGGEPVRVIVRDPARLPARVRDRVEVITGSHGDPAVADQAFAGAGAVFWLCPPDPASDSVDAAYSGFTRPAAEAFGRHKVSRVVGISALGRGTAVAGQAGYVTASLAMDDLIAASGVSYRALLNPTFMDVMLRQAAAIRDQGMFFQPIDGDRKMPSVASRDIAQVATRLLLDDSWSGTGGVPVLGPEDLSFHDMAQIMTEVLGRPVRFQQIPAQALTDRLTGAGMSAAMARGMTDMAVAKDQGLDNGEPRTAGATTPTTFRQWCEEFLRPAVLG